MRRTLAALMLVFWFPVLCRCQSTAALDVCKAIVEKAAHNVYLSTFSSDYYDSVYDSYCDRNGSTKQAFLNTAAKIVYEGVPLGGNANAGASEMSVSEFCRLYSSTRVQHINVYTKNTEVVEKALQTADDCVHFALSGNAIQHTFGTPSALTLAITPATGGKIKISSLGHDTHVTCVGSGNADKNITYGIGTKHEVDANFGTYAIECTRTSIPGKDGAQVYEAASLSLTSSAGNYHVFWPQKTVEPERIAEKIQENLDALRASLDKMAQNADSTGEGTTATNPYGNKDFGAREVSCPKGQYLAGLSVHFGGTCHGACDEDGGPVHSVVPICRKLLP